MALLAKPNEMTQREVIAKSLEQLHRLPADEQRIWVEKLMILSGLRAAEDIVREEAEKLGISLDIRDNKFFQEAYAAGIEDGIGKGEVAMLQRQLERRFGSLPEWAREQLEKANLGALEAMGLRLLDATRLEDVFNGSGNGAE